ncbi:MAG: hypothetical protein A4S09_09440 [Proteobacteria bacterium SG_bin7]|nr:MAG: hypothetical protein A4S09_09440 [Proteobacteria bacterium SG_bin7]
MNYVISIFFLCGFALAEELKTSSDADPNWFVFLGAGAGASSHDSRDMAAIASKKSLGGTSRLTATADIPGLYRKVSAQKIVGLGIRISIENVAENWLANDALVFHNYNYNLSYLHFFQKRIGDGAFYRLDMGYSELWRLEKTAGLYLPDRFIGISGVLALGYGWRLPAGYHFLVAVDQSYSDVGAHFISGNSLYVGFML